MPFDPNALDMLSLLLGVVGGIVVAAIAAWLVLRGQGAARVADGRAQRDAEVARLETERDSAQARVMQLESQRDHDARELAQAREHRSEIERSYGTLEGRTRELGERLAEKSAELERTAAELAALRSELGDTRLREARLTALHRANEELFAKQEKFIAESEERLKVQFGDVAGKVLDQKSQAYQAQSQQNLELVLKPFTDELKGFREKAEQLYGDEAKERATVKGAVEQLTSLNQRMSEQTQELTNALRGNSKLRGNWGEMILDTVLQASGLVEGLHYMKQAAERDEEGKRRLPDVVIKLPDARCVVVDSKASLVAWQDAVNAADDEARGVAMKLHIAALRRHVKDLALKNYGALYGGEALDLVLMFVPIEGALSVALAEEPGLIGEALEKKVALVTPNTLVGVLRAIEFSWARTQSVRSAQQIVKRADAMLDALGRFEKEFTRVRDRLRDAQNAFEGAERSFHSNRGPVNQARLLQTMGVKGPKRLGSPDDIEPDEPASDGDTPLLERQPLE